MNDQSEREKEPWEALEHLKQIAEKNNASLLAFYESAEPTDKQIVAYGNGEKIKQTVYESLRENKELHAVVARAVQLLPRANVMDRLSIETRQNLDEKAIKEIPADIPHAIKKIAVYVEGFTLYYWRNQDNKWVLLTIG